jgi:galactokinase
MSLRAGAVTMFEKLFGPGGRVHVIRAPGRVNLLGEHTDYNEGFVLPLAIEPHVLLSCRGRDDGMVRVASNAFGQQIVEFSTAAKIQRGPETWANYVRGVFAVLIAAGVPVTGMDALLTNTLPVGSGLSSSAAIEIATARAIVHIAGSPMDNARLALICQKAEHLFADVPCGIMDQTIVASARAGHAMLLDCRDLSRNDVPLDERDLRVVIVNSNVRHELGAGQYAERRRACEAGLAELRKIDPSLRALRDVTMQQLEAAKGKLDPTLYRRCRHVVTENGRTTEAASALSRRFYDEAGLLMVQGHQSLRDDFEVSCAELDLLVEAAMEVKGVYGARMTGAGFGGCIVALAIPRAVEPMQTHLRQRFQDRFRTEPTFHVTTATAGAEVLA